MQNNPDNDPARDAKKKQQQRADSKVIPRCFFWLPAPTSVTSVTHLKLITHSHTRYHAQQLSSHAHKHAFQA